MWRDEEAAIITQVKCHEAEVMGLKLNQKFRDLIPSKNNHFLCPFNYARRRVDFLQFSNGSWNFQRLSSSIDRYFHYFKSVFFSDENPYPCFSKFFFLMINLCLFKHKDIKNRAIIKELIKKGACCPLYSYLSISLGLFISIYLSIYLAQSAGALEDTDYTSAEG